MNENARPSKWQLVLALGVLAVVVVVVSGLIWAVFQGLDRLKSGVAAAVIAASATALISVWSLIYSKRWEQRVLVAQAQREQKLPLYEEFVQFWFMQTFFREDDEETDAAEWKQFVGFTAQKFALWAADDVIRTYNAFKVTAAIATQEGHEPNPVPLLAFEQLLLAMRRDLGHENKGLKQADLLRLYIVDIDEYLAPTSA